MSDLFRLSDKAWPAIDMITGRVEASGIVFSRRWRPTVSSRKSFPPTARTSRRITLHKAQKRERGLSLQL